MNVFNFAHVVVATLYNRVDMRDEFEIRVKSDTSISGGWCGQDVIDKAIYREGGCKVFAMTLIAYEQEFYLSGFSFNLFFVHPVLD